MKERRKEARLLCSDLIKVRIEDAGGAPAELIANLEDISPNGACLQFDQPMPEGTRLCLRLGRHLFRGRAVHSTRNDIGHFVGVQFDAGKLWSREIYEPKHLFDPAHMTARSKSPA